MKLEENVLSEIIKRIIINFSPEKIILFGSQVWGEATMDSDIDLLIIKKDVKSKRNEAVNIRKILRGFKRSFDIIVTTPCEFETWSKEWINSIFAEARNKGIVIYERT